MDWCWRSIRRSGTRCCPISSLREHLAGAVSLNSAAYSGAALIGPAMAGALIPLIGVGGVYLFASISGRGGDGRASQDAGRAGATRRRRASTALMHSIKAGVRFARESQDHFRRAAGLGCLRIFARSCSPLLVIFAREEFEVGSFRFGLMVAAPGFGTLLAAFVIASRNDTGGAGPENADRRSMRSAPCRSPSRSCRRTRGHAVAGPRRRVQHPSRPRTWRRRCRSRLRRELRGRVMSIYMLTWSAFPRLARSYRGGRRTRSGYAWRCLLAR